MLNSGMPILLFPLNLSTSMMITQLLFLLGATMEITLDLVTYLSFLGINYQILMRSRKLLMKLASSNLISLMFLQRILKVVFGLNEKKITNFFVSVFRELHINVLMKNTNINNSKNMGGGGGGGGGGERRERLLMENDFLCYYINHNKLFYFFFLLILSFNKIYLKDFSIWIDIFCCC